ncbi:uncharacterized protein PHACADRAFT_143869 [Phanerochaete carnosa HHB-10118-sp]|uniref:Trafficking protein particle complex subunit 10 n=1 Tax=Phanerochaete carnosa (strain HHB-10118-sp) TaxID=650164 RepID=K5W8H1_PHACS|nr:uncharacterized protein PHACADRAFT_143869 [Phanerochaete carnosa HHB-10118-sp]EKM55480.1 hypothetical protein PHACADRAFT_143869 [Phanerochaete carnosa HHB-10118-sp]
MSGPQRATITYTAPPSFLSTGLWKQVHIALQAQVPLRNLHWKSTSRPTIRTIQELYVNLVAVDALRDEHTSQVPQTILEKPLLNAYIIMCEDTETYKNILKKQIKDWHTTAVHRKHQEWLIIHIVPPDSKSTSARIFQVKASVLDKIKADFNVDRKDRCVQLIWSPGYDNPAAWAELINKVKEGILSAFDSAITQREEEVRRSEGQRQMPGWNFCTYFILKESLASSFEGMNLHEEALLVYDELEVLFFQVLRDKNLSWFGTLASPTRNDDSAPLLSVTRKPYRDLILANSISVLDFRVYLLANQCAIFSSMGRVVEVGRKAVTFLRTFMWRLREIKDQLPPHFVESWTYSSALSVVDQCNGWARSAEMTKPALAAFNAVRGELVELARHQLDILGIDFGFLPCQPPFTDALPKARPEKTPSATPDSLSAISNTDLRSALQDQEAFFESYIGLTNQAIELYASAGRRKFALRMHGSLAALDVVRGRLSNAMQTYTSLPAHYSPHGWTSLEAFMLTRALDLHDSVAKPHDKDWLLILLEYLKAYVQDLGKALLITKDDHVAYTSSLVQALREAASSIETDMIQPDHPAISLSISETGAKLSETRDGALLAVKVKNYLPCDIPVDEISVVLQGCEGNKLTFSEKIETLPPGNSVLMLFCPSATVGTYSLYSGQAQIARLMLQWLRVPGNTKSQKAKLPPVLVRVPRDLRALDVKLCQPEMVQLGAPPKVVLALNTGRNDVSKAMIRLVAPAGVQFHVDQAQLETEEDDLTFETVDNSMILLNMLKDTTIRMSVPHTDASAFHAVRVVVTITYVTAKESTITRTVHLPRVVQTALPLAVNVEDFFRGTRLFTRFTLSSTSHQHVRIKEMELRSTNANDDGLKITKSMVQQSGVITVTPEQPGRFLFQLDSKKGKGRDLLHLHITYRMLREEVEYFIEAAVDEALAAKPSTTIHRDFLVNAFVQALEQNASWVELYGITGELNVPSLPADDETSEVLQVLKRGQRPEDNEESWRKIVIPLDVPQMHILAAARLCIPPSISSSPNPSPTPLPLYAGQPISATLTIETSFHWAPIEDLDKDSYVMQFDVEEMTKDWLVSGRKRGDFVAKDGQTFEVPITLIALHHGKLPLPKVAVQALPVSTEGRMRSVTTPSCETHQLHGAEKALVLPRGGRTTFVISMGDGLAS